MHVVFIYNEPLHIKYMKQVLGVFFFFLVPLLYVADLPLALCSGSHIAWRTLYSVRAQTQVSLMQGKHPHLLLFSWLLKQLKRGEIICLMSETIEMKPVKAERQAYLMFSARNKARE